MKAMLWLARACLLGLFCISVASGCGSSVKLFPVHGKVTVDGKPLTSGQVSLVPQSKEDKTAGLSTGGIDSNGEYKIVTDGKDGAPPGTYKVIVSPTMVPEADSTKPPELPFNSRYSNPSQTDLQLEVVTSPGPSQYDLKLTK